MYYQVDLKISMHYHEYCYCRQVHLFVEHVHQCSHDAEQCYTHVVTLFTCCGVLVAWLRNISCVAAGFVLGSAENILGSAENICVVGNKVQSGRRIFV